MDYVKSSPNLEANFDFSNATAFESFTDITLSSTTSTMYQIKLQDSTAEPHEVGENYIIQWFAEIANSASNKTMLYRVQYKESSSVTWLTATEIDTYIGRSEKYIPATGFKVFTTAAIDTIDFRVQWARGTGGTARIQNVNVYLFRVKPS